MALYKTPLGRFRILAFLEGTSLLAILIVTMPLKYLANLPEPNQIVGMTHGLLFVLYCLYAVQLKIEQGWKTKTLLQALLASVIPGGTFYFDKRVLKNLDF
ncbi:MAG: DUF3817 domain-containing protein [Cyclobacteriaceae bacterium]|nr:DUF3817 domain-containing protein [Cyclobacteriaceae bacterium HetDA_MAG_MS6]